MKTRNLIIASATVIAIATVGTVTAQGGRGSRFGAPGGFGGGGLERFEKLLPRLAEYLELSEGQQAQIDGILDEELPVLHDLRDQIRDARALYLESRDPAQFDEPSVRTFAESQASKHVELAVVTARTTSRVYNVLTADQREQLEDLRGLMGRHRRHPRGDRPATP